MKNRYKIISFVLVLILLLSVVCSVSAFDPFKDGINDKYINDFLLAFGEPPVSAEDIYRYYLYIYILEYNADGSATCDEATPDYVFSFFTYTDYSLIGCEEVVGDYVITALSIYIPYDIGLYIFSTKENTVYTLKEAWEAQLPRIEEIMNLVGDRIGDVNYDDEVNIKDATLIQKHIAGLETIKDDGIPYLTYTEGNPRYKSDFNRDGERNIKDATAIQKYIAGLEF